MVLVGAEFQQGRMAVYVVDGICEGRQQYTSLDLASISYMYYSADYGWLVGNEGCGSLTVALYAPDHASSPELVEAWIEYDGAGFVENDQITAVCENTGQPTALPTSHPTPLL